MDKIPMTKDGYDVLMAELQILKNKERPAIIEAIAVARDHGDLKENAEYHSAREKQGFIEGRITELETVTGRAELLTIFSLLVIALSLVLRLKLLMKTPMPK